MTPSHHLFFIHYSFFTWATFYLVGLPDYYQSWPFAAKLILVILVNLAYFPATAYSLRSFFNDGQHLKNSLWLAFYLTLPLFIYDYVLLAWYMDLGIGFVVPYWYLSFFYFSFWIQFPLVALWIKRRDTAER